ncbi:autotransporter domain-containing protein [Myxococcaceae bacterium JPH2]|nr:autotransporter domain-containing protein [Myxococcaceae bacterium JPH2]
MTARASFSSLIVLASLMALPAAAEDLARSSGLAIGLRGAYGVPGGKAFDDVEQSAFGNTLSPQLDVSYFFNEHLSLGGYFQYGVASGGRCQFEGKCTGGVLRLGVDLNYHFTPGAFMRPWVGVGAGYELLHRTVKTDTFRLSASLGGLELGHVNAGLDIPLSPSVFVGPYVTTTVAQYSTAHATNEDLSIPGSSETETVDIPNNSREVHVWIQPGVRLLFRL